MIRELTCFSKASNRILTMLCETGSSIPPDTAQDMLTLWR